MEPDWIWVGLIVIVSYLLGSLPTGFLYGRIMGLDIRTVGSGNTGATNIMRLFGIIPGIAVLLVDAGKGFVAAYYLSQISPYPASDFLRVGCGLACIIGHTLTIFLNFKGGKGVATTCGVFLGLAPKSVFIIMGLFVLVVALTRYVSAGSLTAAILLPLIIWWMNETGQKAVVFLLAVCVAVIIIVRHRSNLGRIIRGTENKFGQRIIITKDKGT